MNNPQPLAPHEAADLDAKREEHRAQQPCASELDDRELEHAHKEKRPVRPNGEAEKLQPEAG